MIQKRRMTSSKSLARMMSLEQNLQSFSFITLSPFILWTFVATSNKKELWHGLFSRFFFSPHKSLVLKLGRWWHINPSVRYSVHDGQSLFFVRITSFTTDFLIYIYWTNMILQTSLHCDATDGWLIVMMWVFSNVLISLKSRQMLASFQVLSPRLVSWFRTLHLGILPELPFDILFRHASQHQLEAVECRKRVGMEMETMNRKRAIISITSDTSCLVHLNKRNGTRNVNWNRTDFVSFLVIHFLFNTRHQRINAHYPKDRSIHFLS